MKIIGLDPGFASLGWARCEWDGSKITIVDGGVFETKPTDKKRRPRAVDDNMRRVREQARWLTDLLTGTVIRNSQWKPDPQRMAAFVCVEAFTLGPKGTRHSAAKQGGSTATIGAVCEVLRLPLLQATPQEIKKATCGQLKASKDEVRAELIKLDANLSIILARLAKGKRATKRLTIKAATMRLLDRNFK